MKKQIHQMMAPGIQAEKLAVEHMRQPSQRVPVACAAGAKGPANSLPVKRRLNMAIVGNVGIVVIVDKIEITYLQENCKRSQRLNR